MEFSLPRLYVVKNANTLPTTGTTATLTANQFGVFLPSYAPATAGNAAAADYLFVAQGRVENGLNLGSNKGEWIAKENLISKNIMRGSAASAVQISVISNFRATKGGQYSILIRAFSDLLDTSSKRGWNEIFTVNGPCIECGDDPCAELDADQTEALVQEFVDKMNARRALKGFLTFTADLDGVDSTITVTGVAQTGLPTSPNVWRNRYHLDAVKFDIFAQADPPTTQDYAIPSPCDEFADVEVTQMPSFPRGTYGEVRDKEIEYYSYAVPKFKELFGEPEFNGLFTVQAEPGIVYDLITIRARNIEKGQNHTNVVNQEFTNLIYCPQSKTTAILAILEPKFGTFHDVTPA